MKMFRYLLSLFCLSLSFFFYNTASAFDIGSYATNSLAIKVEQAKDSIGALKPNVFNYTFYDTSTNEEYGTEEIDFTALVNYQPNPGGGSGTWPLSNVNGGLSGGFNPVNDGKASIMLDIPPAGGFNGLYDLGRFDFIVDVNTHQVVAADYTPGSNSPITINQVSYESQTAQVLYTDSLGQHELKISDLTAAAGLYVVNRPDNANTVTLSPSIAVSSNGEVMALNNLRQNNPSAVGGSKYDFSAVQFIGDVTLYTKDGTQYSYTGAVFDVNGGMLTQGSTNNVTAPQLVQPEISTLSVVPVNGSTDRITSQQPNLLSR